MPRPRVDVAAVSLGLAAVGFAVVVFVAPLLAAPAVQPILALTLAASGTMGLLLTRGHRQKNKR